MQVPEGAGQPTVAVVDEERQVGASGDDAVELVNLVAGQGARRHFQADELQRPLFGRTWEQDLANASRLTGYDPDGMARQLALSLALGKNIRQAAQDLLPMVDGVKSTARRIARTYGMQVAHYGAMTAHESLGPDMVIGYQIHAVRGNPHSRPWHVFRSGTIYYREPKEGQKGFHQMPQPPLEALDPRERPPGTPAIAWN